jgi:FMN reductase
MGIRIVAIPGSVRPGNFTSQALALVTEELRRRPGVEVETVDPATLPLALPGLRGGEEAAKRLQAAVSAATGAVLATPEYHGSYSSVIKLVIDNLGFPSALAGKPVALLGVAAGRIGAIKALEHLRSVCSHVGAIVLPGPVSVAQVKETLADPKVAEAVRGAGTRLLDYIHAAICPRVSLEAMAREATTGARPAGSGA